MAPDHDHDRSISLLGFCPHCAARGIDATEKRKPDAEQDALFAVPLPELDRAPTFVGRAHPQESHVMAAMAAPQAGSLRRMMVAALESVGPMTDDEMERYLRRSHQSVSACRNRLVADGWVEKTGQRRRTQHGNPAAVWRISAAGRAALEAQRSDT